MEKNIYKPSTSKPSSPRSNPKPSQEGSRKIGTGPRNPKSK